MKNFILIILFLTTTIFAQSNETVIEGKVVQISKLPNLKQADYDDCLMITKFNCNRIISGKPVESEILIAFLCFTNRVLTSAAEIKPNSLLKLNIIPFENAPEKMQTMMQSDDIHNYDLELYFCITEKKIDKFLGKQNKIVFKQNEKSKKTIIKPKIIDVKARKIRKQQLSNDLARINFLLKKHGGSFEKWFQELEPCRNELYNKMRGNKKLKFKKYCLRYPKQIEDRYNYDTNSFQTLKYLNDKLAENNVDLIVALFPSREEVIADLFLTNVPNDKILNPYRIKLFKNFLDRGIEVIDPAEYFFKYRNSCSNLYYYDVYDRHPAAGAIQAMAEAIGDRLNRYSFEKKIDLKKCKYKIVPFKYNCFSPNLTYYANQIHYSNNLLKCKDANSPILFFGDSFSDVPRCYGVKSSDLPAHISAYSGFTLDLIQKHGGGTDCLYYLMAYGFNKVCNKKVVILCMHPNYFLRGLKFVNFQSNPMDNKYFNEFTYNSKNKFQGIKLINAKEEIIKFGQNINILPRNKTVQKIIIPEIKADENVYAYIQLKQIAAIGALRQSFCYLYYCKKLVGKTKLLTGWTSKIYFKINKNNSPIEIKFPDIKSKTLINEIRLGIEKNNISQKL